MVRIVSYGSTSLDSTPKIGGEFSNNIFKKAINANPLAPSGNIFWGNNQGITFLSNMYYGTLTSNTPYSQGTGTKKGPPKDAYCSPISGSCDMLTRYSPCSSFSSCSCSCSCSSSISSPSSSSSSFSSSPPPITLDQPILSTNPLLFSTNPSHPLNPLSSYQPSPSPATPISTNLAGFINSDPQLVWSSGLGYYVPNAGSSPAVGTATAGAGQANFDIPVLNDDPSVSYDITGRLRSLNPTCAAGKCDMGCSQSGLTGPVLNYPRSVFNTGVSYPSAALKNYPSASPTTETPGTTYDEPLIPMHSSHVPHPMYNNIILRFIRCADLNTKLKMLRTELYTPSHLPPPPLPCTPHQVPPSHTPPPLCTLHHLHRRALSDLALAPTPQAQQWPLPLLPFLGQ